MTYLLVKILFPLVLKLKNRRGQTNSKPMNIRLYRPISKCLTSIKIQGKGTAVGGKQSNS